MALSKCGWHVSSEGLKSRTSIHIRLTRACVGTKYAPAHRCYGRLGASTWGLGHCPGWQGQRLESSQLCLWAKGQMTEVGSGWGVSPTSHGLGGRDTVDMSGLKALPSSSGGQRDQHRDPGPISHSGAAQGPTGGHTVPRAVSSREYHYPL